MMQWERIVERIDSLPPMPVVMSRLAVVLSDPDVDTMDIVEIIQYEPGLTAGILKMANSAYFGSVQSIASLRQAVARLGLDQIFRLVVISSTQSTMKRPVAGYDLPPGELWRHSVAAAIATQFLAREIGVEHEEIAFTAALLHDVGKLVIGDFMDVDFKAIEREAFGRGVSFEEAEREVLGADHAQIGAAVLEKWNLPGQVIQPVRWHHDPDGTAPSRLVDIVHVADALCLSMGIGSGRDELYYRPSEAAIERCRVSKSAREAVISHTLGAMDDFAELFALPTTEVHHGL